MVDASAIMLPSCSTPLRRSDAITQDYPKADGRANYSMATRIATSLPDQKPISDIG
jgi:hypothetical protein